MESSNPKLRVAAATIILGTLLFVPAPLLPPHWLARNVQSLTGIGWKAAYLVAAVGLQSVFYCALGALAALTLRPASNPQWRLFQITITPLAIVILGLVIRTVKAGHPPVWINAIVPVAACLIGVFLGFSVLYRHWKPALAILVMAAGSALWLLMNDTSAELKRATEANLRRVVAAGPALPPSGDARFGALLRLVFTSASTNFPGGDAIQQNRSAILAWGIAVGDPRLARFVGLDSNSDVVRQAATLGQIATLQGRADWPKHYALSAALAVLEHPLISDAGGLMKEQLDALTRGSGFSFGDLTADRAGVRFASVATRSESAAREAQVRLRSGFVVDDFFPSKVDFPENLTIEEFRRDFGGVGSQRYRNELASIEAQLDACQALSAR